MKEYILISFVDNKAKIINNCRCKGLKEARIIFKKTTHSYQYQTPCHIYEWKGNNFRDLQRLEK